MEKEKKKRNILNIINKTFFYHNLHCEYINTPFGFFSFCKMACISITSLLFTHILYNVLLANIIIWHYIISIRLIWLFKFVKFLFVYRVDIEEVF